MKWICKLIGHRFAGYNMPTDEQKMPDRFFCSRCKDIVCVKKGWN